jgi:hypothetical protein
VERTTCNCLGIQASDSMTLLILLGYFLLLLAAMISPYKKKAAQA